MKSNKSNSVPGGGAWEDTRQGGVPTTPPTGSATLRDRLEPDDPVVVLEGSGPPSPNGGVRAGGHEPGGSETADDGRAIASGTGSHAAAGEVCDWMAAEIAARDRRLAELEHTCKAAVRDRELATALAGKPLVAGAVAQLLKLWRDEFDVHEEGGAYKVSAKDGRPAGPVVNDWLASPEYSHFCLPSSRGGTGARDANRPAVSSVSAGSPKNLGEAIVNKWREESAARPNNLLKPIGLRRHR